MSFDESITLDLKVDFLFRCNYCIKMISKDHPVYMRNDNSYCSTNCRHRGRSSLYGSLRGLQLDRLQELRKTESDGGTSIMSTALSESSIASSLAVNDRRRKGPLGWVFGKVFDAISARLPDGLSASLHREGLVQSASAAMLRHMRPGSSLHRLLGYLPQADSILGLSEACSESDVSDADCGRLTRG
ncbi:unnamed protein product [Polarella glacialis]|uniref:FLZ-type domain-containing protein n=2 Tax=Polarella glacialis TaxID=89957 RepID=A0A813E3E1_POLGL|nr:unnamed protein product [Polarella glacialis]